MMNVPLTLAILRLVVKVKKYIVMITTLVLKMSVMMKVDANSHLLNVTIIMLALKIDVILLLDVFSLLSVVMMMITVLMIPAILHPDVFMNKKSAMTMMNVPPTLVPLNLDASITGMFPVMTTMLAQ
jgi:hypothetical protein